MLQLLSRNELTEEQCHHWSHLKASIGDEVILEDDWPSSVVRGVARNLYKEHPGQDVVIEIDPLDDLLMKSSGLLARV